jgi:CBS domain-containing protein
MATTNRTPTLADTSVGSVMTTQVKTVEISKPLVDGVKIMGEANIGCIVVVENERPVGIFTERDLVRKMAEGPESLKLTMSQVMSKPMITISPTATIWDALTLMGRNNIRRLPVIDGNKLVGILTERDVFRLIISQQSLLLESVSESIPASAREKLRVITGALGIEKPPARMENGK